MNVGSLFSGIGGFDLGLERAGMRVEWQVENNEFCREVLKKHWPQVPCHYDITAIDWRDIPRVDLICGGFPCQPFSLAGKQRGKADDRYLWPEVVRCLDVLRPTWFLGENVPGLINLALDQVCTDLESLGYTVWPVCIPACAVDAPHIRQRVWIVAHTESQQSPPYYYRKESGPIILKKQAQFRRSDSGGMRGSRRTTKSGMGGMVNGVSEKMDGGKINEQDAMDCTTVWPLEPPIARVSICDSSRENRADKLKSIGNAVVPQVVEAFGRMIMEVSQ